MEYIIITFESTNFAIQAEAALKNSDVNVQIIPTPREITLSCGISILTSEENLSKIDKLVNEGKIRIKEVYRYIKDDVKKLERLRP
ncbi:DUF3343 domain-containing protein [Thermobrachium celere]|uniref:Putative Se/S carrier protein-like domain-containing protein n=1 Tax=Thermobrachium celere DSM 8682 TaxID=941824 RepID=R7RSG5_9CLOT|nr:DUF3343 domain-containing protein [Thermobrachium celere]GFR35111.1 hypothetical protein TCEA9_09230 [Thermobrachium celere]CDF58984.1 hypothetical protein TCEL_02052 [Thermobrachium celere DSM 8682]